VFSSIEWGHLRGWLAWPGLPGQLAAAAAFIGGVWLAQQRFPLRMQAAVGRPGEGSRYDVHHWLRARLRQEDAATRSWRR
jgi:hypothetical protein